MKRGGILNKWVILFLICVFYVFLIIVNEYILEIGGLVNIFWKIGLFVLFIGVLFLVGVSKIY